MWSIRSRTAAPSPKRVLAFALVISRLVPTASMLFYVLQQCCFCLSQILWHPVNTTGFTCRTITVVHLLGIRSPVPRVSCTPHCFLRYHLSLDLPHCPPPPPPPCSSPKAYILRTTLAARGVDTFRSFVVQRVHGLWHILGADLNTMEPAGNRRERSTADPAGLRRGHPSRARCVGSAFASTTTAENHRSAHNWSSWKTYFA